MEGAKSEADNQSSSLSHALYPIVSGNEGGNEAEAGEESPPPAEGINIGTKTVTILDPEPETTSPGTTSDADRQSTAEHLPPTAEEARPWRIREGRSTRAAGTRGRPLS